MNMSRRDFVLGSAALPVLGARSGLAGEPCGAFDESLAVVVSDLHVGAEADFAYTREALSRTVDEILAMRPLPRHVVCLGDVALSFGLEADYAVSKPILGRLVKAGIDLKMTMGNHDRRSAFLKHWPEYASTSPVPGRIVSVVSLRDADLVLLDALKGADDRKDDDYGPVEGTIDPAQMAWLEGWMAKATRPFLVCTHQGVDLYMEGEKFAKRVWKHRHAAGWIYGHDHEWLPNYRICNWASSDTLPVLAVPSAGLWGDIGYVLLRTSPTQAVAELVQRDFYFPNPTRAAKRPLAWDRRLKDHAGMRFVFDFPRDRA